MSLKICKLENQFSSHLDYCNLLPATVYSGSLLLMN